MNENREYLFISYATEDWQLAEWLCLRLTAEGYRVWCDRFKLLGGESYPRDIPDAITNHTFRLIALLSRSSINKANPTKERTIAHNISQARRIDFIIPLKVDNIKTTELGWMSDLTYIPFDKNWAEGLRQLLLKLKSINTPSPFTNGKQLAINAILQRSPIKYEQEPIWSNLFEFVQIPDILYRIHFITNLTRDIRKELADRWDFYHISSEFYSFGPPPYDIIKPQHYNTSKYYWPRYDEIGHRNTKDILASLLRRSLYRLCIERGLFYEENMKCFYFPNDLLDKDRLYYTNTNGSITYVKVIGTRNFWTSTKPVQRYRYHLAFKVPIRRDIGEDIVMQLKVGIYLTDLTGNALEPRLRNSRRKHLTKNWFNKKWLNIYTAISQFISGGKELITIKNGDGEQIILSGKAMQFTAPYGIREAGNSIKDENDEYKEE